MIAECRGEAEAVPKNRIHKKVRSRELHRTQSGKRPSKNRHIGGREGMGFQDDKKSNMNASYGIVCFMVR